MPKKTLSPEHKNLVRRYLLWAYKSTKESFERIERKGTQLLVDEYILAHLTKHKCEVPEDFKTYIADKRKDEVKLKSGGEYLYLKNRLKAITDAIKYFLGKNELKRIEQSYEEEFTRRILEAREH
jgi:hypothetical protein